MNSLAAPADGQAKARRRCYLDARNVDIKSGRSVTSLAALGGRQRSKRHRLDIFVLVSCEKDVFFQAPDEATLIGLSKAKDAGGRFTARSLKIKNSRSARGLL